ncbi:MAG: hypothetical protein K5792_05770 [Butyrivibrio sp.]|nr:hypothetical protein [Butyrivibrio sp.]
MNTYDLLDAIGNIEPKYVNEADIKPKSKSRSRKFYPFYLAAAALLLTVIAGTVLTVQKPEQITKEEDEAEIETFVAESYIPYMIMVDGNLYYSTDAPYTEEIPDDAPIKVLSYVDGTPEEDGQQNFDETSSSLYVVIDETHIAVQIDGNYTIFEKIEE